MVPRRNPRNKVQRDVALCILENHFCLIWMSQHVSLTKAVEELKLNFKIVDK